eukprot:TRINITY_DN51562_c0_g1_i1.p1 TRINITY_DN51562_c0_g1~~TRINITY_DN51562_c0_g1_i1.p1  ORF type:complete len:382 (-),score=61.70 TRINITY_DN51562_c0_g1_i1:276-1421(-)
MSSAIVMNREEIERMKRSVLPPEIDQTKEIARKERKAKSEDKLKHWPNTLEALRKKKESFMKDKEDRLEAARQEVDLQEAELRRAQRLESIKRANQLLYEQTDKMKNLRSQQSYCDVLETRITQIDDKQKVKDLEKVEAAKYHQTILERVRKGDAEDVVKAQKVKDQFKLIAISREQQLKEVKERRDKIKQEEIEVGLQLRKRAQEDMEEEIRLHEEKIIRERENNYRTIQANEKLRQEKEMIKAQEQLAEETREQEIEKTEKRNLARKALEKRRFEKKQIQRQKIIDAAVEALSKKTSNENYIQAKQEAELQEKEDKKFADKEEKRRIEWENIVASRTSMIEKRKQEKIKEKQEIERLAEIAKEKGRRELQEEKDREQKN